MKTSDIIRARGQVTPYFVDLRTGNRIPWERRHNTISYEASYSMATAFAGDLTYVPNRIGIIYSAELPSMDTIGRNQDWTTLHDDLESKNADVQIATFSYSPSIKAVTKGAVTDTSSSLSSSSSSSSSSEDDDVIPGNSVIFHAHSDSYTEGAFGTCGGDKIFTTGKYILQAVLLNKNANGYKVIARASLGSGISGDTYYTKPENFEVAIDWAIKFF